jgi:tetratricopeptide (TPR) repeat protein
MLNIRYILGAAVLLAVPSFAPAAGFDYKVRNDFFAGFAGDKVAFDRAMKAAEQAISDSPGDAAEAMSWHGSGLLAMAGTKFAEGDVAGGMQLWAKAAQEMDKAGEMAPRNIGVLIPRAASWFVASRQAPPQLAEPILAKALADYETVYEIQKTYFDRLDVHMRSELLFGMADGYARQGNSAKARERFEQLAALGPKSGHLAQAELFLKGEKYTVKGIGCAGCHAGEAPK